jgi:Tfp pilus assembly protein PilV
LLIKFDNKIQSRVISSFLKKIKSQRGATLLELIISFIILGIALPAVILMVGQMGIDHGVNESIYRAVSDANAKMEEIVAFKKMNNDSAIWADTITDFAGTETLADGSQRTVTIVNINNWINEGPVVRDAYQVDVSVVPLVGPPYSVSLIFAVNE